MSLFPRKIAWVEPWSIEYAEERLCLLRKEMPPPWRMAIYCIVLPAVAVLLARLALPSVNISLVPVLCASSLFMILPFFTAVFPDTIHITPSGIFFQCGSGGSLIKVEDITSLSFETRCGKRCLIVRVRNRKGAVYERKALLPKKRITEHDIMQFLYEVNFAHLIREDSGVSVSEPQQGGV